MVKILDTIRKMFKYIHYSDKGTNHRTKKETAFMYFTDYLDECEKGWAYYMKLHVQDFKLKNYLHAF